MLQWLAVAADPWPGAVAVWRSGDGASFALHRIVGLPAMIGRTLTALPPGPLWRWDPLATAEVELSSGALASIGDEAALAGGNLFAVQGPDGCWEIFSAARAELIGARRYRLSRLLRGLAGSEPQAARSVPSGATIVRLDEAVTPLADDLADLGRPWRYRIGPASRDYADPSYVEVAATAGADALKPLAPVHVRARRGPEGVTLTWVRRTRKDGDAWEPSDVPLGEDASGMRWTCCKAGRSCAPSPAPSRRRSIPPRRSWPISARLKPRSRSAWRRRASWWGAGSRRS